MPIIKVATGIYINGQQQFIYKQEEDTQSMSGLNAMLKSAREEAATYRIKAREAYRVKEEAKAKLEGLEGQITYYKELYKHFKSKYEAATLVVVDDPFLPVSEEQKETVEKYIKEPLFNKEQTMETEQLIELTEDASLYQFRNYPDFKIIEILVPENKDLRKERTCTVWYRDQMNELKYILVFPNGSCDFVGHPCDVILKPVPKTRPMDRHEIIELHCKGAVFGNPQIHEGHYDFTSANFWTLAGFGIETGEFFLNNGNGIREETFVKDYKYSLDYTKTWHPLTVEEK